MTTPTTTTNFAVNGQGVFIFENHESTIEIQLYDTTIRNVLIFEIITEHVNVHKYNHDEGKYEPCIDPNNRTGINLLPGAFYWISLNAQTQQIYLGVGEPRLDTVIYQYQFAASEKSYLESLDIIRYHTNVTTPIRILKDPITRAVPLLVRDTDHLSMLDIAKGTYLPKANLSLTSQKLHNCISGERFVLDDDDFPHFSDAIEQSIATPGLWCYEKLQSKSREFNPDHPNLLETYLRITLGENNGDSPGIPYVMEIWPKQHYSPIHSHAAASAVIRVLHGSINVRMYPFLCAKKDGIEPFATAVFKKDDITWISPSLNQTHQLINTSNEQTCVTIQCYMYEDPDTQHYDYFDYLDEDGNKQKYEPDSDMDFVAFRELMQQEWEASNP
jgi:hypothetical protein